MASTVTGTYIKCFGIQMLITREGNKRRRTNDVEVIGDNKKRRRYFVNFCNTISTLADTQQINSSNRDE